MVDEASPITLERVKASDADDLVERARGGDKAAFRELFRRHRPDVSRLVFRMLGPSADLEDLVQEVFLQVHRSLGDFKGQSKFSTWLHRVTVNVVLMCRRAARSRPIFSGEVSDTEPDRGLLPDEDASRRERLAAFRRVLERLPEKKRTVFVLHELEGLPPIEIAAIVEAPVLTVRTRLFYARREICELMRDEPTLQTLAARLSDERNGSSSEAANGSSGRDEDGDKARGVAVSDPFDARLLRRMVTDLVSEEMPAVDWDAAEDRLLARIHGTEGARPFGDGAPLAMHEDEASEIEFGDRISEVALGELSSIGLDEDDRGHRADGVLVRVTATDRLPSTHSDSDRPSLGVVSAVGVDNRASQVPSVLSTHTALAKTLRPEQAGGPTRSSLDDARVTSLAAARERRRWVSVAALVAVAACFAFVIGGAMAKRPSPGERGARAAASEQGTTDEQPEITAERLVDPSDVPMAAVGAGRATDAHDLAALHAGDVIEASAGPVSFAGSVSFAAAGNTPDRSENVSWTLAPGSRVRVRTGLETPGHVLVLENGSIRAEIASVGFVDAAALANAPRASSLGPFVVEAGDTAVAVGDTIFSVTRSSKGIVVDVEEGSVAVGPRLLSGRLAAGNDGVDGPMKVLSAPSRGSFSLDGGRSYKSLDPVSAAFAANDRGPSPAAVLPVVKAQRDGARHTPVQVDTAGPGPLSMVPTEPVLTEASIRSSLGRCFSQVEAQRKAASGKDKSDAVSVVMRSRLSLRVADDGAIKGASFNPPLRPDLQSCGVSLLSAHVDRGARTLEIPIEIRPQ